MKVLLHEEPTLQFADGTHVDVRAGIASHGTLDRDASHVRRPIRVGMVGTATTIAGVRDWLESCSKGVRSTEARLRDLRPDFPGMTDTAFGTKLELLSPSQRAVSDRELQSATKPPNAMTNVVSVFINHSRDLVSRGGIDVLVVAPPVCVFELEGPQRQPTLHEGEAGGDHGEPDVRVPAFHDLFKAQALEFGTPCQIVRPDTYGGGRTRRPGAFTPSLQDPATCAWNFHTALYYKAGGVPWRLMRDAAAFTTCFIGIGFFKSTAGDRVLTSVAQIFNERGEGIIVQGGNARIDKDDRVPHLDELGSRQLLLDSLASYRREHRTLPARVVIHKTSSFDGAELAGCTAAVGQEGVESLELISVRKTSTRLFRTGTYPPLRGTTVLFDDASGFIYLKGSVPQFRTYPGMYVPAPTEFNRAAGESPPEVIAREILELSKLNFNNTQFDGGDPITISAARRVGDILKYVPADRPVQSQFRFFT